MHRWLAALLLVIPAPLWSQSVCSITPQVCSTATSGTACSGSAESLTPAVCARSSELGPFSGHATLTSGLLSYWKFDEVSSGSAVTRADDPGTSDLTDQGSTPSAAGKFSLGASFTAASEQKLSSASDILPAGAGDYSVAIWVYQAGNVYQPAFWNGIFASSVEHSTIYIDATDGGRAGFWVFDGTTFTSGQVTGLGSTTQWWLLVGVYDSAAKQAYVSVNGGALTSTVGPNVSARVSGTATISQLGHSPVSATYATGVQDQLVVWSRVLSASDISELWNGGVGTAYGSFSGTLSTGVTHAYTLDETATGPVLRSDAVGSNSLSGNAASVTDGAFGEVAAFVAASSHSLTSTGSSFDPGHTDFTVAGWVYFGDDGSNDFFATAGTISGNLLDKVYSLFRNSTGLGITGNRIGALMGNGATQVFFGTAAGYAIGWHHVVLSNDTVGNTLYLYVDDGAAASTTTGESYPAAGNDLQFGAGVGFFADCRLKGWGIWSRVLTAQERTDLYNSGNGLFY